MGRPFQSLTKNYLVPGSVWTAVIVFSKGPPRRKYLIVLSVSASLLIFVLPTSKGRYFHQSKRCAFVYWPNGTTTIFKEDTWVGCDNYRVWKVAEFEAMLQKKKIHYEGQLDSNLLEEILNTMQGSRQLSPQEKMLLFGR